MIIKRSNRLPKKIIIPVGIIIVCLVAGGIYWYVQSINKSASSNTTINQDKPTQQQIDAGKNSKDATIKGTTGDTGNLETGETQTPNNDQTAPQITITAANQNGDTVQIRTLIPSVTTAGNCTLTLSNGTSTITRTADVQAAADSATCKGFDIPVNALTTKGSWVATVVYATSSGSSKASQSVDVN
jgi:hypothetical protein